MLSFLLSQEPQGIGEAVWYTFLRKKQFQCSGEWFGFGEMEDTSGGDDLLFKSKKTKQNKTSQLPGKPSASCLGPSGAQGRPHDPPGGVRACE